MNYICELMINNAHLYEVYNVRNISIQDYMYWMLKKEKKIDE